MRSVREGSFAILGLGNRMSAKDEITWEKWEVIGSLFQLKLS